MNRALMGLLLCLLPSSRPAVAADAPVALAVVRQGEERLWSDAALLRLPQTTLRTTTPWGGSRWFQYVGPRLREVIGPLAAVHRIEIQGDDDYVVDLPVALVRQYEPILAHTVDRHRLRIRDKGPLLLLFPHGQYPALQTSAADGYYVWFVRRIVVQ